MKVLITGGAGFIGSHIADSLIEKGQKVVIVDNLSTGSTENINPKAQFYKVDITQEEIYKVFEGEKPEYVIHHAAQINVQNSLLNPFLDAEINILGTINVLESCRRYGVKKVIYASSAAVYGVPEYLGIDEYHRVQPISFYGISKHTPEHYIELYNNLYGLNYTILRYANVFGERQVSSGEGGVVAIFFDKLLKNENVIIFGDGTATRDYIYVKDVVRANLHAIEKGTNEVINIGTGIGTTVNELFEITKNLSGTNITPIYGKPRDGDIKDSLFDVRKANVVLGWEPQYTLTEGLKCMMDYYVAKSIANSDVAVTREI